MGVVFSSYICSILVGIKYGYFMVLEIKLLQMQRLFFIFVVKFSP